MDLIKDIQKGRFGIEGKVFFKLYGKYIDLRFEEAVSVEYVEKCAQYLNSLSDEVVSTICKFSIDFCKHTMEELSDIDYPERLTKLSDAKEILEFIDPTSFTVNEPRDESIPAINLYCSCSWEGEHDMQILVNNDKVVYVGAFDGLDPWQTNLSDWWGNFVTGKI